MHQMQANPTQNQGDDCHPPKQELFESTESLSCLVVARVAHAETVEAFLLARLGLALADRAAVD